MRDSLNEVPGAGSAAGALVADAAAWRRAFATAYALSPPSTGSPVTSSSTHSSSTSALCSAPSAAHMARKRKRHENTTQLTTSRKPQCTPYTSITPPASNGARQ